LVFTFSFFSNFQTGAIFTDVATVKSQFSAVPPSNEQMQKLLRLLHEVLLAGKKSEEASAVIIVLKNSFVSGKMTNKLTL
jgi:translation initiation factor 3 subunit M